MVVVKADGYGHGMLPCAPGGADRRRELARGRHTERGAGGSRSRRHRPAAGLALRARRRPRAAGRRRRRRLRPVDRADLPAGGGGRTVEQRARVHLKIDTGLSRNGAAAADWAQVCAAAAEAEQSGALEVVGVWSHLAAADEPGHASVAIQLEAFQRAYEEARSSGLEPSVRHVANSAAALLLPEAHLDLVRVGIAAYGIDPAPGIAARAGITLRPAMTLRAQLVNVKQLAAGAVGLLRLDLDRRPADNGGPGADRLRRRGAAARLEPCPGRLAGGRAPVRGRICMDQFVVDLGAGGAGRARRRGAAVRPGRAR